MLEYTQKISRARRRWQLLCFIEGAVQGSFIFAWLFLSFVILKKLFYLPDDPRLIPLGLLLCLLMGGIISRHRKKITPLKAALRIDEYYKLKERLSTAYALSVQDSPIAQAQRSDAEQHSNVINAGELFPLNIVGRLWRPLIILGLTMFMSLLLPQWDLLKRQQIAEQQKAEKSLIRKEAKRLERIVKKLAQPKTVSHWDREAKKLAQKTLQLQLEFKYDQPKPREAILKLSRLSEEIKKKKQMLAKQAGRPHIEQLPRNIRHTRGLWQDIREGRWQAGKKDIQQILQQLASGRLPESQQQQLAEELGRLADSTMDAKSVAQKLKEAARAMEAGEKKEAQEKLSEVAKELDRLDQLFKDLQELDAMVGSIEVAKAELAGFYAGGLGGEGLGELQGADLFKLEEIKGEPGIETWVGGLHGRISDRPAGPEWGIGTTNIEQEGLAALEREKWKKRFSDRTSQWQEEFIQLYDPRITEVKAFDTRIRGQKGKGPAYKGPLIVTRPGKTSPMTEIEQAFLEYRQEQEDALARQPIPYYYKEQVKSYFDALTGIE